MKTNRVINLFILVSLILAIALTIQEAAATTMVIAKGDAEKPVCTSLPSASSIHSNYDAEKGMWVTYTDDGPTGVDGGLIQLLSENRLCSE